MVKKILIGLIVLVFVLAVVIGVGKNIIAKAAIITGVNAITGLTLDINKIDVGVMKTLIGIEGLKLFNPSEFEDRIMVDFPEIYVDYDLKAFLNKKVHLEEVRLNLTEFVVITNKDGVKNIDALVPAKEEGKEEKPASKEEKEKEKGEVPEIQIDVLQLKIGKVIIKDYSKSDKPSIKEVNVNIDERFENITDPKELIKIIVLKALMKTTLDLGNWKEGMTGLATDTTSEVLDLGKNIAIGDIDAVQETVKNTANNLKKMIPFGK